MANLCNCLGRWGCLSTTINDQEENFNPETAVRNAKIKYVVIGIFATLAALTVVAGALGFSGHLSSGASLFAKNALWVTLAGSLAIALALIASVGYKCWSAREVSTNP